MKILPQTGLLLISMLLLSNRALANPDKLNVAGVKNPVQTLNGTWKISINPPESFWKNETATQAWPDIQVPGECQMQGFPIKHDQPFVYKHKFFIPADYHGNQIFLKFHGVYSYARVWINGQFLRDHAGGFTPWECNITGFVRAGDSAMLTVEVTDRTNDISYGSGYAKHQIGGILRNVELMALPAQHFRNLWYETNFDEQYQHAELGIFYELSKSSVSTISVSLFDKENQLIKKVEREITGTKGALSLSVINPAKWDAEHPNLYRVVAILFENGKEIMKSTRQIGFREVVVKENKLLVNGQPVKLRGACRHDIHPTLGRTTTAEYDKMDVLLAREANMNFIRTSHYPPSEAFLEYCDQYGLYVEDETAVCFVGSHRMTAYKASGASQSDTLHTRQYLSQLKEMVDNHRNHPSVIIWSIGNENVFGTNFEASYRWMKANDNTRPVMFSYPGQVPDSIKLYDILSMHYPDWRGNINQYNISTSGFSYASMPVLYDEWAHVACYNNDEIKYDPNVRDFWGQSLDSMWTNLFEADGGLGGAIWCMIDETFMLPEDLSGFNQWWGIIDPNIIPATYVGPCIGYGEWGIIDTWRRKKPEFWNTKKAYSPAKIYTSIIDEYKPKAALRIPVHNRYDHTNFSELKITWRYGEKSGQLKPFALAPHQKGVLIIPPQPWTGDIPLNLSFYQHDTTLVDQYTLHLGKKTTPLPMAETGNLAVSETDDQITFSGEKVVYVFNKKRGLLDNVAVNGKTLIQSGPFLHLRIPGKGTYTAYELLDYAKNWQCKGVHYSVQDGVATIHVDGVYDSITVSYSIIIDAHGLLQVAFEAMGLPEGKPLQEFGLKFITAGDFQQLAWNRDAYFSGYPAGHLGSPEGEIDLTNTERTAYRTRPANTWEMDAQSFYYHGINTVMPYSNIARSLKANIRRYSLIQSDASAITVISEGSHAARFDRLDGNNTLIINEQWDYPALSWGNYTRQLKTTAGMKGKVIFRMQP